MSFRVKVNFDLCEGNARCMQVAPQIFKVDDKDMLEVLVEQPDDSQRDAVEAAVAICPRQALSIEEVEA